MKAIFRSASPMVRESTKIETVHLTGNFNMGTLFTVLLTMLMDQFIKET